MNISLEAIWAEKYRPKTLSELILDEESKGILNQIVSSNETPNLLLSGPPGVGKSSTAKIIVNDILKCNYLYINASDESGIDTIRQKVTSFAQTQSFDGNQKVIILDEADQISSAGMGALRNTMEQYIQTCRFILTCNYPHKIIDPIKSRCQHIRLKPGINDCAKYVIGILKKEGIHTTSEELQQVVSLVKKFYPDLRRTLNELQKSVRGNRLNIQLADVSSEFIIELIQKLRNEKISEFRKFIITNEPVFFNDYENVLQQMFNYFTEDKLVEDKKADCLILIADHLYKCVFVADQEINFMSACLQLKKLL